MQPDAGSEPHALNKLLRRNDAKNKQNTMKQIFFALFCAACMTSMEAKTIVAYFSATGTTKAASARLRRT